jgi:hypothetical protein
MLKSLLTSVLVLVPLKLINSFEPPCYTGTELYQYQVPVVYNPFSFPIGDGLVVRSAVPTHGLADSFERVSSPEQEGGEKYGKETKCGQAIQN